MSTFADIEHMLTDVRPQTGARFEYEAYDVGHLYTLAYYLDAGPGRAADLPADDHGRDGRDRRRASSTSRT